MKKIAVTIAALSLAGAANAGVPFFNGTCPGDITVHADERGPVLFP